MSARPGFADLTDSNRRSLMRLLVEVRVRRSDFVQVVDSTFEMSKKKKSDLRVRFRREYRSLEHMVLVQFPECANTWPFADPPRGRSVCWLRNRMRKIDQDLAWAVGLTNHQYRCFLHTSVLQAIAKENNP